MALNSQQRGRVFERFIQQILINSGFTTVIPDDRIVYQTSSGLMLHGLAQPHNTDVLVDPPFQIPFFFPARLIIECKCYKKPVDLSVLRGALGLREDVNSFDIVTEQILKDRRNYSRRSLAVFERERYFYQVAVASLSGFTKPAQEFALVHRIPLINIARMPFSQRLKDALFRSDGGGSDEQSGEVLAITDPVIQEQWDSLRDSFGDILKKFCVAILSSGDILFLYTEMGGDWIFDVDEIELHWHDTKRLWSISPRDGHVGATSYFELPDIFFEGWAQKEYGKGAAIDYKEKYFQNIYVIGKDSSGEIRLKLLKLSSEFIKEARQHLSQL